MVFHAFFMFFNALWGGGGGVRCCCEGAVEGAVVKVPTRLGAVTLGAVTLGAVVKVRHRP